MGVRGQTSFSELFTLEMDCAYHLARPSPNEQTYQLGREAEDDQRLSCEEHRDDIADDTPPAEIVQSVRSDLVEAPSPTQQHAGARDGYGSAVHPNIVNSL